MWRFQFNREPTLDLTPVTVNGKLYNVDAVFTDGRTASASLKDGKIVIRIPRFARDREARRLFSNLRGRIARMMEKHPERFEKNELIFRDGQALELLGKVLPIEVRYLPIGRGSARVYENGISVRLPAEMAAKPDTIVTKLVTRALRRSFLPLIESRVNELNTSSVGVDVRKVSLKDIRSRWGSYSSKSRRISLGVRLLFAPPEILDYVIVHELCHGKVHNHGKRFWSNVEKIIPDYKERRRWLRTNGDMLGSAMAMPLQRAQDQGVTSAGIPLPSP